MSDQIGIREYLDSSFDNLNSKVDGINHRLDLLNGRVRKVEEEQASVRGGISIAKWLAGILGLPGLIAFVKAFLFAGK